MNPDSVKASYRRMLGEFEQIAIRRYTGTGANRPYMDYPCQARVLGYKATELIGTITQGDEKVIAFVDDLVDAQFPLPIQTSDYVVIKGKQKAILNPDQDTIALRGQAIAYSLQVRG